MNALAKSHTARRDVGRVIPVAVPAGIIPSLIVRRSALVNQWSVDPGSNRPVCFWSQHWIVQHRADGSRADEEVTTLFHEA